MVYYIVDISIKAAGEAAPDTALPQDASDIEKAITEKTLI